LVFRPADFYEPRIKYSKSSKKNHLDNQKNEMLHRNEVLT